MRYIVYCVPIVACGKVICVETTMIDTHAHLDTPLLYQNISAILERAKQAGLSHIVNVGERMSSSSDSIQLAEQ